LAVFVFGVCFCANCDGADCDCVSGVCSVTGDDCVQPKKHTPANRLASKL